MTLLICYNLSNLTLNKTYMGRKKKEEKIAESRLISGLQPETKQGILAVIFIALGAFLLLARFKLAGIMGAYTLV